MNTIQMYDAQASSIKVEDIANNSNNRLILSRIKQNSADDTQHYLCINADNYDKKKCYYSPEGATDMGWLGYFIGNSTHLRVFEMKQQLEAAVYEQFFRGFSRNSSISIFRLDDIDPLDGKILTMLCPFFKCNPKLKTIRIKNCNLEEKEERLLALAICSSEHKSLQDVSLYGSDISDRGLVDIITALSFHPYLKDLDLESNYLQLNGCRALALLLKHSANELQHLDLSRNGIDSDGLEALVPALKTCSHLETLRLVEVGYVKSRGWQQLASIFPNSNIEELSINWNDNVDGLALTAFASSLVNNNTLHNFNLTSSFRDRSRPQQSEWQAVIKLLCNSSSINSTYLSNHTLEHLTGYDSGVCIYDIIDDDPTNIEIALAIDSLLTLNQRRNKKEVAMIKILQHHNGFDMKSLFEWEFKALPLMINWFQRASAITMPENFEANIGPRKLSCIYQFVRAMPELYVSTRLRKQLEDVKSKESEIEKRQMDLRRQQLIVELQLKEVEDEKKSVEDEKKSIMEKLGR